MTPLDSIVITPEWVAGIFGAKEHFHSGKLSAQTLEIFETPPSYFKRFEVSCTDESFMPVYVPRRLLLKVPKPHKLSRFLREVRFYGENARMLTGVGLVQCVSYSEGNLYNSPYLVLDDVTHSHRTTDDTAIDADDIVAIAEALARLHAAAWNRSDLEEMAGMSAEESFLVDFSGNDRRYAELLALFGDHIPEHWRSIYEDALRAGPDLLLSRGRCGPLTLCHPDAHTGNFLLPRDSAGNTLIVDWHDYQAWWGVRDVARLLLVDTHLRRSCEREVLEHYHSALCSFGVTGYDWEELWLDYRLSVLQNLFVPLGNRRQPWVWDQLELAISAYEDLDCRELITTADM